MDKSTVRLLLIILSFLSLSGCPASDPLVDILYRDMIRIPAITNFKMGYSNVAMPEHTVPVVSEFHIAKYETTYELWKEVYTRAKANGYVFSNDSVNTVTGVCGSSGTGSAHQPVSMVSWRDCLVWCNAYSAMEGLKPVYYKDPDFNSPLKSCDGVEISASTLAAGNEDNPYVNWSANGYRLPTEAEWELSARYLDGTVWLPGDHASGDTSGFCHNSGNTGSLSVIFKDYAWYDGNSGSTNEVGQKIANQLLQHDVSGGMFEWCWDWHGAYVNASPFTDADTKGAGYDEVNPYRIMRGGSWSSTAAELQASYRKNNSPAIRSSFLGFRVVRR